MYPIWRFDTFCSEINDLGSRPKPSQTGRMPSNRTRVNVRQLPALIRTALGITWHAGRRDLLLSTGLQAIGGVTLVLMLLLARGALNSLLTAINSDGSLSDVLPWIVAMALTAGGQSFANTVQRERQHVLGELVTRHVQGKVLDVTARVDLATFDDPEFHNRVERVGTGNNQALHMIFGLSGLAGSAFGVIGALVGVVAVAPVLLPLLLLISVPAWFAASRRGEAFWDFFWKMTPRDRQRNYLAGVLRERNAAKEVRAFGLAGYLRGRYDELYDGRITELRRVSGKQVRVALVANLLIGAVLAATLVAHGLAHPQRRGGHRVGRSRGRRHRDRRRAARRRLILGRGAHRVGPLPRGLPSLHRRAPRTRAHPTRPAPRRLASTGSACATLCSPIRPAPSRHCTESRWTSEPAR